MANEPNALSSFIPTIIGLVITGVLTLIGFWLTRPPQPVEAAPQPQPLDTIQTINTVTVGNGKTFPITLHLIGGAQVTSIDFVENRNIRNVPVGDNVIIPHAKLLSLTIINDGVGDILFSTNTYIADSYARTPLVQDENIKLKYDTPTIERINISAPVSNAQVRLIGVT